VGEKPIRVSRNPALPAIDLRDETERQSYGCVLPGPLHQSCASGMSPGIRGNHILEIRLAAIFDLPLWDALKNERVSGPIALR
jgi:hypothetical protein